MDGHTLKSTTPDTNTLIENILPLVRKIASIYAGRFNQPDLGYDELVQIGSLALVEAARRWKPNRQYRDYGQAEGHFWGYAKMRVIGAMIDEARRLNNKRLVRPVMFVPLEDEPPAANIRITDDAQTEAETIELVQELYNQYGEETCEFVTDYALNTGTQTEFAQKYGIPRGSVSYRWQNVADRIKKIVED